MRPYDEYLEDFDGVEDFAYRRSQALHKLVKEARREERHRRRHRHRGFSKDRHHRGPSDWDDDDEWASYVDETCGEYSEDLNSSY